MPYQRSTQASGFRARKGPDESKQLRQYATALDTQRKENVKGMERQGVQMTNEMTRIDALASKKDTYELNNLRNFSKTFNNFLDTVATNVVKPVFDQQIEDGVTLGIRYQQGDPDAIAKVETSEKQLEEIESRIKEQSLKTSETEEAIRVQWEKEGKIASLEEEYRLLNIKKLGSNRAFGFRKGILMESATGWDAYRDSSLLYKEDNPDSTENIGTEDDPIIVGQYHRYSGEEGQEKKKAILGHLTNKYVVEKGKEAGLSTLFINKYLTNPILEQNAKFQQKEAQTARLEEASAASENNKEAISLGIDGVDADNGKELTDSIQKFILTEPANQRGMNTAGSKVINANDLLIDVLVGESAQLRTGSHANVDDQEDVLTILETAKFEVPGITKKGEKKTLPELWPTKFNMDEIRAKLLKETGSLEQDRRTSIKNEALGEKVTILQAYHKDRDTKNYEASVALMKSNDKYIGMLDAKFFTDMLAERDTLSYNEEASRKKLKEIRQGYGNNPIPSDHAIVRKLHPDVLAEAEEKGLIAADLFGGDNEAKASYNSSSKALLQTIKNAMKEDSPSFTWDDENDQVTAATSLIDSTLRKYTKQFLDLNEGNENYSLSDAVSDASGQLDKEIKADLNNEILPTANGGVRSPVWDLQDDGFVNGSLNKKYETTATSPLDQAKRIRTIVNKTQSKIKLSNHVDIFSDTDQPPIVEAKDFVLVEGKVGQLWQQLSQVDPLGRSPEMLYTLQANKVDGVEVPTWDADVQQEMAEWNQLHPNLRIQLSAGNFTAGKRAMQEVGVLDLDSTINTLLTQGTDFDITEAELPQILNSLGLESMSLEELKANPQLFKIAYKKKILDITRDVQAVTTDQNQAIRMVFAGVRFGDINKWDNSYTLAALNSYYSGDRSALDKLESAFNMNPYEKEAISIQGKEGVEVFEEPSSDLVQLNGEIKRLESEIPPKFTTIKSQMKTRNPLLNTFAPIKQPNPYYTQVMNRIQLLKDRKVFIEQSTTENVDPRDQGSVFTSGKRLVGVDRYTELQEQVLEQYPSLSIYKGSIVEPKVGTFAAQNTKLFEARNMLQTLLFNEILGGQTIGQSDIIDKGNVLGTPLTQDALAYELGSEYAGNFVDKDLVTMKGYEKSGKGQTIRIRKDIAPDLESLLDVAATQNIFLNFSPEDNYGSGYRTREGSAVAYAMNPEKAAKAGQSVHNLGAAVDFTFSKEDATAEKQLEWLKENGPKYGFFPWSEGGVGSREEAIERLQNLKLGDHEYWHWDYRPDLMENN